jgi:hypothetical protein
MSKLGLLVLLGVESRARSENVGGVVLAPLHIYSHLGGYGLGTRRYR